MPYLIDTNCFIEPQNRYYSLDVCPGFWGWLDQQNRLGVVYSIERVRAELMAGKDDLAEWARQKDDEFFLIPDNATASSLSQVAAWVATPAASFKPESVAQFLRGADPILIAQALAHNYTVVTAERMTIMPDGKAVKINVKIPNVCQHFGVPYTTLFELLRKEGAKFVLPET